MEVVRCFMAVDVDEPKLIERMERLQEDLRRLGPGLKLVGRDAMHVTLRFLGEIPQKLVDEVAKALDKLENPSFNINLKGLGAFPSLKRPRVIWIGVAEGSEQLIELHRKVEYLLKPLGFKPEGEPFSPHITIARVKRPIVSGSLTKFLSLMVDVDVGVQHVDSVKLKRSVLTPRGPIYSDIFVKKLL